VTADSSAVYNNGSDLYAEIGTGELSVILLNIHRVHKKNIPFFSYITSVK